jgi:Ca2+-binding RTX toxin-like protein
MRHGALRTWLGVLAFAAALGADRNASALLQANNPFLGLSATAYVGLDPSDGYNYIAWKRASDGLCEWVSLGSGGFSDNILINASPSGDTIVFVTGSVPFPWCHYSLVAPNYNGHTCDVNGGAGNDHLQTGSGNTYMYGNGGDDVMSNNGGAALVLQGGNGDDTVLAGTTNYGSTQGNAGNDCIQVSPASTNANMSCGSGVDTWAGPGSMPADCEMFSWACCPGIVC